MIDSLIIGGGTHGTYLSIYATFSLVSSGIRCDDVRVFDPNYAPLSELDPA
jgi:hypothetical protein